MEALALKDKVQHLLDTMINPAVAGHGGWIQLVNVKETVIYLQMGGGCHGCAASMATLREGVERLIKEQIPEVTEVVDATDHSTGQTPYFTR